MSNKYDKSKKEGLSLEPLLTRPESVAIVALGGSTSTFLQEMITNGSRQDPYDEIWTLNRGLRAVRHDKLFVMDDLKWVEEKKDGYANFLKKHEEPIITSTAYPEFPSSVEYPLHEVLECCKTNVFCTNTVSYMVAYAIYLGVKEMYIYGADFFYPNGSHAEKGGQAVAYMLGIAQERGINYKLPQTTTLLYSNEAVPHGNQLTKVLYGYHRKDELERMKKQRAAKRKER